MKTIDELRRARATLIAEWQGTLEAIGERDNPRRTDEEDARIKVVRAEIDRMQGEIEEREALWEAERSIQQLAGQPSTSRPPAQRTADTAEAIFCRYLRTADPGAGQELPAYNNVAMSEGTPAAGGYAVPVGMYNEIIAKRDELMIAGKVGVLDIPGTGLTVNVPYDDEPDVLFTAVNEAAAISQDSPALNQKAMTLVKYGKYLTLSWELVRDEDAKLIPFLNGWLARGWAATHNSLLITEAYASGTAGLTLASPTAMVGTNIPGLVGKLMPEYQDGAAWVMHPTTWADVTAIGSSSIFSFAPTPNSNLGVPSLWGYPVNTSSYANVGVASAKTMIFGNWNYVGKREGTELTILRDPYTGAGSGQIKMWVWFDAVYKVLQPEAIQYATQST